MSGGGGWRGGNGGPWGQGPRNTGGGGGGRQTPPDLEELLRRSQDRLRRVFPGRGGGGGGRLSPVAIIALVIVVLGVLGYSLFTFRVEPDQLGVVLRFGEYNRTAQPGLNFRLPLLETVYTPAVTRETQVQLGYAQADPSAGNPTPAVIEVPSESLMLTGDENIVDVHFSVVWVINSPQDYLFNLVDPDGTVEDVAESVMREAIGRENLRPLQTELREETRDFVAERIQQILDAYEAGIRIVRVNLSAVDPPPQVVDAFRDVQAAQADNERFQNEANAYANQVIPEARGQAAQITEAADAYRQQVIAEATGEADRFLQVYQTYATAPEIIRERIYLETMADILADMNKIIVDERAGNGIVPYLPLNALTPGAGQ
ncbi:MAG: FtsH protease activity modulator HflK [Alphaproteobacteria bacterium]